MNTAHPDDRPIVTLTMNPAIDGASEADKVRHTHKVRTYNERYDPGGGGINVARVLGRLGSKVHACYLAGGATGELLTKLVRAKSVACDPIHIEGETRIAHAVYDRSNGREYRFVPEGPEVAPAEWQAALDHIEGLDFGWLVASGSLPRGVPDDFYVRLSKIAQAKSARMVLDTSGTALRASAEAGGLEVIKPSLGEFEALIGRKCSGVRDIEGAARDLALRGVATHVVVTLGHNGAVVATAHAAHHARPVPVKVMSATGAGDSFVAAMTHMLARGADAVTAFHYGMAAGTAAVMTPGTDLCTRADVERLFKLAQAAHHT